MESKIQADIEVPVFRPKEEDCQHFREYIERIEKYNNFAKVFYINDSYFAFLFIAASLFSIVIESSLFSFSTNHLMLIVM